MAKKEKGIFNKIKLGLKKFLFAIGVISTTTSALPPAEVKAEIPIETNANNIVEKKDFNKYSDRAILINNVLEKYNSEDGIGYKESEEISANLLGMNEILRDVEELIKNDYNNGIVVGDYATPQECMEALKDILVISNSKWRCPDEFNKYLQNEQIVQKIKEKSDVRLPDNKISNLVNENDFNSLLKIIYSSKNDNIIDTLKENITDFGERAEFLKNISRYDETNTKQAFKSPEEVFEFIEKYNIKMDLYDFETTYNSILPEDTDKINQLNLIHDIFVADQTKYNSIRALKENPERAKRMGLYEKVNDFYNKFEKKPYLIEKYEGFVFFDNNLQSFDCYKVDQDSKDEFFEEFLEWSDSVKAVNAEKEIKQNFTGTIEELRNLPIYKSLVEKINDPNISDVDKKENIILLNIIEKGFPNEENVKGNLDKFNFSETDIQKERIEYLENLSVITPGEAYFIDMIRDYSDGRRAELQEYLKTNKGVMAFVRSDNTGRITMCVSNKTAIDRAMESPHAFKWENYNDRANKDLKWEDFVYDDLMLVVHEATHGSQKMLDKEEGTDIFFDNGIESLFIKEGYAEYNASVINDKHEGNEKMRSGTYEIATNVVTILSDLIGEDAIKRIANSETTLYDELRKKEDIYGKDNVDNIYADICTLYQFSTVIGLQKLYYENQFQEYLKEQDLKLDSIRTNGLNGHGMNSEELRRRRKINDYLKRYDSDIKINKEYMHNEAIETISKVLEINELSEEDKENAIKEVECQYQSQQYLSYLSEDYVNAKIEELKKMSPEDALKEWGTTIPACIIKYYNPSKFADKEELSEMTNGAYDELNRMMAKKLNLSLGELSKKMGKYENNEKNNEEENEI